MTCCIIPIQISNDSAIKELPLIGYKVAAGFPSPADDHLENTLNLNDWLVKHEAATFFVRASGQSMQGIGIFNNDVLVVDRSITPVNGCVVVAVIDGEYLVKLFRHEKKNSWLQSANSDYPNFPLTEDTNAEIWGVVTGVARQYGSNACVRID